ncbi:MAG: helix-hairpin-helix domain-containing protein [Peptococcaceae bacterium]|nr:helix-hairpin-helix domain-containing protein [Peptococcaceae bacterium]
MTFGRREQLVALVIAAVLVFGLGYRYAQIQARNEVTPVITQEPASGSDAGETTQIMVHVVGAVEAPGVYRLDAGSRVVDAVDLAKPTSNADLDALNLAALLEDGRKIIVPAKVPAGVSATPPAARENPFISDSYTAMVSTSSSQNGRININTAGVSELDQLPGIGPALARRIIAYRQQNGPFSSVDELINVRGIGEKTLADLRDKVTVY